MLLVPFQLGSLSKVGSSVHVLPGSLLIYAMLLFLSYTTAAPPTKAIDTAMAAARDRVLAEYNAILDSFANLIRSARIPEENVDQEKAKASRRCARGQRMCTKAGTAGSPLLSRWCLELADFAMHRPPSHSPGLPALLLAAAPVPRASPPAAAVTRAPRPPRAAQGPRVPGELMEVFVEKLLQSCAALLGLVAELKRNALLNDFAARNTEVGGWVGSLQVDGRVGR